MLPVAVLIFLAIFSISSNKQDRFILPIFPLIAIIISAFICSLPRFKKLSVVILSLFSIFQYFIICYGDTLPAFDGYLQKPKLALQKAEINESGLFSITNEGRWLNQLEKIIKTLDTGFKKYATGRKMRILLITQDQRINAAIKYSWLTQKMPFELRISAYEKPEENLDDQISRYDFIIIENEHLDDLLGRTKDLQENFKQNSNQFDCIKTELITFRSKKDTDIKKEILENYMPGETKICLFKNKCLTD